MTVIGIPKKQQISEKTSFLRKQYNLLLRGLPFNISYESNEKQSLIRVAFFYFCTKNKDAENWSDRGRPSWQNTYQMY